MEQVSCLGGSRDPSLQRVGAGYLGPVDTPCDVKRDFRKWQREGGGWNWKKQSIRTRTGGGG